jgi:hypothetical protein
MARSVLEVTNIPVMACGFGKQVFGGLVWQYSHAAYFGTVSIVVSERKEKAQKCLKLQKWCNGKVGTS